MNSSFHANAAGFLSRLRQGRGRQRRDVFLLRGRMGGRGLCDGLRQLGQHLALASTLGLLRREVLVAGACCVHFVGGQSFD